MRAAVCTRYGGPEVVEVRDVPTPEPKDDEVLVRVRATTVSAGDHRIRAFDMPKGFRLVGRLGVGFRRPRQPIFGNDLAGDVTRVGPKVTRFRPGDAVMAAASATHAEFVVVGENKSIVKKPENQSYEEAASLVFGGLTALYYLHELAEVRKGQRVAIYGASGAVGSASVQLAKHFGARVTAVASGRNASFVQSLGADEVIDYTKESFLAPGRNYDVVFDTVGQTTHRQCRTALGKHGVYLPAVASPGQFLRTAISRKGRVRAGVALATPARIAHLARLAESGAMRPAIDRVYPLEDIVDAHRYVDTGRKKGNVVITP